MFITVQDAMKFPCMSQGTLIAGQNGLLNSIRSVTVLEIPEAESFLETGLLALTSFYAIANDPDAQIRTIRLLCKHHAAGLLVFNVGRENALPEISHELCKLCDTHGLPLIQMPDNISYYNIFYEVMYFLLYPSEKACKPDALTSETYINRLLYLNDSCSTLLSNFRLSIHHEVAFFSHNHKCVFPENGVIADISCDLLRTKALVYMKKHDREYEVTIGINHFLIIPVIQQSTYCGSIVLANIKKPLSQSDQFLIELTKKALYISVFNSNRFYLRREKQYREFFMNLLDRNYNSRQQLISLANELDLQIESVSGILVICMYEIDDSASSLNYAPLQSKLYHQAQEVFADDIIINLPQKRQLVVLSSKENAATQYLPRFSRFFLSNLMKEEKPVMGIGPVCTDLEHIPLCYKKAVDAVHLRSLLQINDLVANYDCFRVYDILFKSLTREQAEAIVSPLLSPVRAYDEKHNSELETTFSGLLTGQKSTARVAEELFLHKNTVLQRKAKIQSLYPFDPFSPTWILQFEIAFLLKNMYGV